MGTLEQWEKDLLGQVEPKEVQRDPSGNGGGCCCLGAVLVLLVVLALAVQSWAACSVRSFLTSYSASGCTTCSGPNSYAARCTIDGIKGSCSFGQGFDCTLAGNGGEMVGSSGADSRQAILSCAYEGGQARIYFLNCSTPEEADSSVCVNSGKEWKYNPETGQKECIDDPCEGYEDYLQDIKDACRQNGGTDDFALVPNADGTCGTSGFCDLCTAEKKNATIESARKSCCELGSGFNPENFNFSCKTTIDGLDKTWDYTYKGCEYNFSVNIGPDGSSVAAGCGPSGGGSSDSSEDPDSSPSGGGSSDSQGGGSSDSQGGVDPSDTTGTGASSSASQAEQDISQMADDIGKMVSQDSAQLSNTEDIKQILLDYMRCVYDEDCPLNRRDTTIVNVSGGGGGGNVTIDLTALTAAVNDGNAINESNGEKLDSINARLGSLGLDSIRAAIRHGDSSMVAALDDLGGIIAGLDSTAAGLASRIDSNRAILGSIDSTLKAIGDTSGGGGFDTSGYMAILRGWGDSLGVALWGYPCDTTGGRKCDNEVIGADGLENARNAFKSAGTALVDSINGGAVGDSLAKWSQVITDGGGVLSGDGSANCPSVFTRVYDIPLGPAGVTYPFGPFSKIICYDFGFGITFWALARVVLRALVAISCMWWIFKAATGTEGGNDED